MHKAFIEYVHKRLFLSVHRAAYYLTLNSHLRTIWAQTGYHFSSSLGSRSAHIKYLWKKYMSLHCYLVPTFPFISHGQDIILTITALPRIEWGCEHTSIYRWAMMTRHSLSVCLGDGEIDIRTIRPITWIKTGALFECHVDIFFRNDASKLQREKIYGGNVVTSFW